MAAADPSPGGESDMEPGLPRAATGALPVVAAGVMLATLVACARPSIPTETAPPAPAPASGTRRADGWAGGPSRRPPPP